MTKQNVDPLLKKERNKGWDNLKPIKKGEVRNPTGRPKKEVCIPDILRKLLDQQNEFVLDKQTNLEGICKMAIRQALGGDKDARNWIADRTEGKALERIIKREVKDEIIIE